MIYFFPCRILAIWERIDMLQKIIFAIFFAYSQESLFDPTEENPFNLNSESTKIIMNLYESEGLLNGWLKGCMQDFVRYAKEYDDEKFRTAETTLQLRNNSIKLATFTVLCKLVIPSFDDNLLNEYAETAHLNKVIDSLSKKTTDYINGIIDEIISNLGLTGWEVNSEVLNQYIDLTISSIEEYLNKK